MPNLATSIVGKQLRDLEHQVDAVLEIPGFELPNTARIILRSASALLMAARWEIEDRDHGRLPAFAEDRE